MNQMKLVEYSEPKPNHLRRLMWLFLNRFVFPVSPRHVRVFLLRLFGAKIGSMCLIYRNVKIYYPWNLELGDTVCIGPRVEILNKAMVKVGSGVVISQDSYLCTASHDIVRPSFDAISSGIEIGDNCWVAARASILPGVSIGEGAVVGACAVVAKDVDAWSVVCGNPAVKVKGRHFDADAR